MSRFQIKLNGGLPGVKAKVLGGATVTATIDNTVGFSTFAWSIAGTDETTDWPAAQASIVGSGSRNETVTLTAGGLGSAIILQAVADGGVNPRTGAADPELVATVKIWVAAANGAEVIAINETRESDATWAYVALFNDAVRATYGGGPVLSDANPQPLGTASPGVAGTAMRGDAVIAHGDLAGGSLHALAVASVAGVGGSAGFASAAMAEAAGEVPQMLLDIAAIPAWSTAATPDTLAQRTSDGSLAVVNATCSGTATITGVCTAGGLVSPTLSHATSNVTVSATGSGKVAIINGAAGVVLQAGGNNIVYATSGSVNFSRALQFDGSFNASIYMPAAGTATGKSVTVSGQSVVTGTGGSAIVQAGTGSVASGEVQLSGDVIRGVSNGLAWMTTDTYTKVLANGTDGITLAGKNIKFQVNDATTPATVRTVMEIIREADGVGTRDKVRLDGPGFYAGYAGANFIELNSTDGSFGISLDGSGGLRCNSVEGWRWIASGEWVFENPINVGYSTATAGQIRTLDGEVLNAKGSTGAEVCLVSYDKTLTSAIFGSDGAGSRQTATSVLAGSTSAQLVVGSTSQLEARADHVKANTQIAAAVKTAAVTGTTTTLDCALGNVHSFSSSNASTCTVSLSNTKAGAEIELFVTKSGSGLGITLSPTWFDMIYSGQSNVIPFSAGTGGTTIYVRGRVLADGGKVFVTEARAT